MTTLINAITVHTTDGPVCTIKIQDSLDATVAVTLGSLFAQGIGVTAITPATLEHLTREVEKGTITPAQRDELTSYASNDPRRVTFHDQEMNTHHVITAHPDLARAIYRAFAVYGRYESRRPTPQNIRTLAGKGVLSPRSAPTR